MTLLADKCIQIVNSTPSIFVTASQLETDTAEQDAAPGDRITMGNGKRLHERMKKEPSR